MQALARSLTQREVPTLQGRAKWTHNTVGRLLARTEMQTVQAADPIARPT
jgi:hypothetical protein